MPIDYSKWDKIELSDDSDIEVHPNVDKNSFIKWKQRDIHEKRIQRENDIKSLKVQKEMYIQLNKRVDSMLIKLTNDQFTNEILRNEYLNSKFDKNEKCELDGTSNDTPTYNEMVEDLFTQMVGDLEKENKNPNDYELLKSKIKEHRAKIETVLKQIDPKLDELLQEKSHHITSEDIHDGWNSSFVNKDKGATAPAAATTTTTTTSASDKKNTTTTTTKKETVTTVETLNTSTSKENKPSKPLDQLDELEVLPETIEFAKIDSTKLLDSVKFLEKHLYIISEQQKDSLMMKSFDYILDNDIKMGKSVIHQSLILQYLNDLINAAGHKPTIAQKEQIVRLFIGKLLDPNHPAAQAFKQDFEKTYNHIVSRCEHIKNEQAANGTGQDEDEEYEGVEQIQLRSMDPNSEIVINLPDENSEEYKFFKEIPISMQNAIKTKSLDEINKVFGTMPVEEAEDILELFDKCGVIQIQAVLENEDQFNQLKNQYNEENSKIEEIEDEEEENTHNNSSSNGIKDLNIKDDDEDVKFTPTTDLVD